MFYWYALLYTPSSQQWLDLLWEFLMELSKMQMPQWSDSSPTVLLLMLGLIPIIYHCLPSALIWVYAFPCCEVLAVDQLTVALCGGAGAVNKTVVVNSYSGSCKPRVRLSNPLVDYQDHSLVVKACYQSRDPKIISKYAITLACRNVTQHKSCSFWVGLRFGNLFTRLSVCH